MADTPGYISIKEYAAQRGISLQAVYKQIRAGKIEYKEISDGGRMVKYIKAEQAAPRSNMDTAAENEQDNLKQAAAPIQLALDLLGEQLKEKDRQIERLQAEIKEKDNHIREQAEKLTELLKNSQQLQAHAQHLLEAHEETELGAGEVVDIPAQEYPEPDKTPKKRRSIWAWFWGE